MRRYKLLVVDDEPGVVQSLYDLLRLDYDVVGAHSAASAFDVMRRQEVHVVMSDQRMPEMSGVQFLAQLCGEFPEAIRLLFTGYTDIRTVRDAINEAQIFRYIEKPWDPDALLRIIKDACREYEVERIMSKIRRDLDRAAKHLDEMLLEPC